MYNISPLKDNHLSILSFLMDGWLVGCFMVFNATFNTIWVILWRSVLLVEETGVPRENHRPAESHWQTVSHNVVSSTPRLNENWTHNVSHFLFKLQHGVCVWYLHCSFSVAFYWCEFSQKLFSTKRIILIIIILEII